MARKKDDTAPATLEAEQEAATMDAQEATQEAKAAAGGWGLPLGPASTVGVRGEPGALNARPAVVDEAEVALTAAREEVATLEREAQRQRWVWTTALRRADGASMVAARRRAGEVDDLVLAARVVEARTGMEVADEEHAAAEAELRAIQARARARASSTPADVMRGQVGEREYHRNLQEDAARRRAEEQVAAALEGQERARDRLATALNVTWSGPDVRGDLHAV